MRLPTRKAELLNRKPTDPYLTKEAVEKLKKELKNLEINKLPVAATELRRTAEMGDLSENAAYHFAKDALRRINNRILIIKTRLNQAVIIDPKSNHSGRVEIGSTVIARINGRESSYRILGPQESNPSRGCISYLSPVGSALLRHSVGDKVTVEINDKKIVYEILKIE